MERYPHLLTCNAVRRERMGGREYLVTPIVMLVPGVLNGSRGPLYYPPEEIGRTVDAWNGMPLTLGHPTRNGRPVSGRDPRTFDSHGLGFVYGVSTRKDGALVGNGWFDVQEVQAKDHRLLRMLERGQPVEVSTGLHTDNVPARNGAAHNGRSYVAIARNYRPDHLAILLDQQGACSLKDGCGVVTNTAALIQMALNSTGQPRDDHGQFASTGGSSAKSVKGKKNPGTAAAKRAADAHPESATSYAASKHAYKEGTVAAHDSAARAHAFRMKKIQAEVDSLTHQMKSAVMGGEMEHKKKLDQQHDRLRAAYTAHKEAHDAHRQHAPVTNAKLPKGGRWVTISGAHVYVGDGGKVLVGPDSLKGDSGGKGKPAAGAPTSEGKKVVGTTEHTQKMHDAALKSARAFKRAAAKETDPERKKQHLKDAATAEAVAAKHKKNLS